MPSKKAAIKDLKQSKKRQEHNLTLKKALKKDLKKMSALLETKDAAKIKAELGSFSSSVDKAVKNKLMHKNKASRQKARVARKIHQLGVSAKAS